MSCMPFVGAQCWPLLLVLLADVLSNRTEMRVALFWYVAEYLSLIHLFSSLKPNLKQSTFFPLLAGRIAHKAQRGVQSEKESENLMH